VPAKRPSRRLGNNPNPDALLAAAPATSNLAVRADALRKIRDRQMTDPDVFECARLLVERYGDSAEFHCGARIGVMIDQGDKIGEAVWKRVLAAIRELQRGTP
jgi:hypothetical protein